MAKAVPYQGGSLLNINDNTYNELLNTGKLYGLGSEHLIEVIQNYYKLCERETEYQNQNNTDIGRGLIKFEDSFNLLFEDYNRHPSKFNLIDYPFYLNSKSKEYKNYQSGLLLIREGQTTNKKKMLNIIKETEIISKTIKSYLASDDKIL